MKPMIAVTSNVDWLSSKEKDEEWAVARKWDGYRAQLILKNSGNHLLSRRGNDWIRNTPRFSKIVEYLNDTILDGEVISQSDSIGDAHSILGGSPDYAKEFQRKNGDARMILFDCLKFRGLDIRKYSLRERRKYLKEAYSLLRSESFPVSLEKLIARDKTKFYRNVIREGGEGVLAKDLSSPYLSQRSDSWRKIKEVDTYDFIILGFTQGKGRHTKRVGAIIYGVYDDKGKLIPLGKSSGMTDEERNDMAQSPRKYIGKVAEFDAQEITDNWAMRFPRFKQLRLDKNPKEVTMEDLKSV